MICPNCGEKISDSAKFCTKCGANIPEILEQNKTEEIVKQEDEIIENRNEAELNNEVKSKETVAEDTQNKQQKKENNIKEEKKKKEKQPKATKTKKKHTGLKIIIILILLLVIVCGAIYGLYKIDLLPEDFNSSVSPIIEKIEGLFGIENNKEDDDNKNESKADKEDNEDKEDEENQIKKKEDDEDLVFDYYNKTLFGNTYKVPEINLDYDNIEDINEEIAELVDSNLKKYEKLSEVPEGGILSMDYVWYENDNILSLVFYNNNGYMDNYYVYNVDIYTGEEIDNKEILDAAKIDEDEFVTLCQDATEDYYDNYLYYKGIQDNAEISSIFNSAKDDSTKASNFSLSKTSLFLNKNGELNIIAKFTTIAGAGYNYKPVNIENIKKNNKPLFEGVSITDSSRTPVTTNSNTTTENTNEILNSTTNTTENENTTNTLNAGNTTNLIIP